MVKKISLSKKEPEAEEPEKVEGKEEKAGKEEIKEAKEVEKEKKEKEEEVIEEEKVEKRRGKIQRKPNVISKKFKYYDISSDKINRKNPFCPRCGEGVFMANHSDRHACGSCGYTVWKEH